MLFLEIGFAPSRASMLMHSSRSSFPSFTIGAWSALLLVTLQGCGSRSSLPEGAKPGLEAAGGSLTAPPGPSNPGPLGPDGTEPDPGDDPDPKPDPSEPCRRRCTARACGAPDGCGGICDEGDCPDGLRCSAGACVCDLKSCGGCCDEGRCLAGTEPDACGSAGSVCTSCSSGTCVDGACWSGPRSVTLFGGSDGWGSYTGATWVWSDEAWFERKVSGPGPRSAGAMALLRGRNVIFGGIGEIGDGSANGLGDTHEWDGEAWTRRDVVGPSARWSHEMATLNGKVVLFGGYNLDERYLGDTWEWDGESWTNRQVAGPPGRVAHAMATVGNQVVMFGGQSEDGALGDTWVWNGEVWTELHPSPSPSKRIGHSMAGGPSRAVLFGGGSSPELSPETWEWDGKAWSRHAVPGPASRSSAAMAAWGTKVLLFGGLRVVGGAYEYLSDTWEWDGSRWSEHRVAGPRGVANSCMASQ